MRKDLTPRLGVINVLVVDDDHRMAQLVRNILNSLGFRNVHLAKNGQAALEALDTNDIDLIITDWQMEPLNGIELIKYLRGSNTKYKFTPIIMLTGNAERHEVEIARDAGVTEFVVKPFTARALVDRIVLVVENPRNFVLSKGFKGPDRRRRDVAVPEGKHKRKQDKKKQESGKS